MNKIENNKKVTARSGCESFKQDSASPLVLINLDPYHPGTRGILCGIRLFERRHGPWNFMLTTWGGLSSHQYKMADGYIGNISKSFSKIVAAKHIIAVGISSCDYVPENRKVYSDPIASGNLVAEHFIERGVKDLAVLSSPGRSPGLKKREQAFQEAALKHGCSFTNYNVSIESPDTPDMNKQITSLSQWLHEQPKPLGIMAIHDRHGWCALAACQRGGIRVPEEVAVIGTQNDESICGFCQPTLSSLAQDQQRIGYETARILDDLMQGRLAPIEPVRVPPLGIVARESADLLQVQDPLVAKALSYIKAHVGDEIHARDVLAAMPASPRTLQRRFRAVLGRTIAAEVRRTRVEKVQQELLASNLSLAEVADLGGYGYLSQMCRDFRAATNMTPTQYRRAHGM